MTASTSSSISKRNASEMMTCTTSTSNNDTTTTPFSSSPSRRRPLSRRQRGNLATLLTRKSPFSNETGSLPIGEHDPEGAIALVRNAKILVVGAGGLGCEILKDLAMSCVVRDVVVMDLDTIDVTNLNRQFLFRSKDVGHSKAESAAKFINNRCPWMNVVPYHGKIQDKDAEFYKQFNVVISGLDNVEARRWLNGMINNLVEFDSDGDPIPESIIPIIDGGTEGFSGQSRLILPRITSCFECSLDAFAPSAAVPLCTIAETPRIPEHCIAYAYVLQWPRTFPDRKLDADSPSDMKWVFDRALERGEKFGIGGVTYMLTLGVVKNIIPAVASTNAIVSAVCVNEAMKVLSFCSQSLNTYKMYMGSEGIYSHTFVYEQKSTCPVCTAHTHRLSLPSTTTLNSLLQQLCDGEFRLEAPSITSSSKTLYMRKPAALEKATRGNLDKNLKELMTSGEELVVTDPVFPDTSLNLVVTFEDEKMA
mmetsp:Transcript_5974/g.13576  ORF Transcript_5974/g.13576 Transcript_5974/m.13576 type:complete len:478 (-) Transcript_5974:340-1773(-)